MANTILQSIRNYDILLIRCKARGFARQNQKGVKQMKTQMLKRVNLPWKFHAKQYLTCDLYYDAGGYNWYLKTEEERGYYISVSPSFEKVEGLITIHPLSGAKGIIITCKRRTAKQDARAVAMFADEVKRIIGKVFPDREMDYTALEPTGEEVRAA